MGVGKTLIGLKHMAAHYTDYSRFLVVAPKRSIFQSWIDDAKKFNILLVPGSVGFRSLNFVMERDVFLGLDTAFALLSALIALVAGLLFGNLLVPSRRNL